MVRRQRLCVCSFFTTCVAPLLWSAGFAPSTADYREKEDMYDEIIRLKKVSKVTEEQRKNSHSRGVVGLPLCLLCLGVNGFAVAPQSLQAHKSDNQQLKVKLRRLEEDTAKREKQIEELLDPAKVGAPGPFLRLRQMLKVPPLNSSPAFRDLPTRGALWTRKKKEVWCVCLLSTSEQAGRWFSNCV